jgi:hypothetical protein
MIKKYKTVLSSDEECVLTIRIGGLKQMTHDNKMKLVIDPKYPLAAKYDPEWIYAN